MKRKGSVLISVIIMIAFLTSIAVYIFEKSQKTFLSVLDIYSDNQGAVYAAAAFDAFKKVIAYDDASYDGVNDIWRNIPSVSLAKGSLSVSVIPLDERIYINALSSADEKVKTRVKNAIDKLTDEYCIDSDVSAILSDWVNASGDFRESIYVYDRIFNGGSNRYTAKYAELETLAEIKLIDELAPCYSEIRKFATSGDSSARININLASAEVIEAFLPELSANISEIISLRDTEPFKNKDEIYRIMGDHRREEYREIVPFFDVKSTLFYIRIEVNIGFNEQYYHLLVRRNGGRIALEKYIEGGSVYYF